MNAKPKTMSIQSFKLGMNNRAPDFKLRTEEGYSVHDAVNVDITQEGSLLRRRGQAIVQAGAAVRSLWASDNGSFYVDGASLRQINSFDPFGYTEITSVAAERFVSLCDAPEGGVYWTDGFRLERIVGGASVPLNPPPPALVPAISVGGGALRGGYYNVVITAFDASGRESAPTTLQQVLVPDNSSITLTGLQAVNVYVGGVGGEVPYLVGTGTSVTANELPSGRACPTYGMAPMPAGDLVCQSDGRLLVANGAVLFISEPFAPGLYKPEKGYILFPAPVTVMEPINGAGSGLYVVADQTYWLGGDITKAELTTVLPYGAMSGSAAMRHDAETVHWMTPRGLVQAGPGGQVKNMQEKAIAVTPTSRAATLLRESNGMKQAVSALFGSASSQRAAASSYMDVEMIHGV